MFEIERKQIEFLISVRMKPKLFLGEILFSERNLQKRK
jgi:hypothetical protein